MLHQLEFYISLMVWYLGVLMITMIDNYLRYDA